MRRPQKEEVEICNWARPITGNVQAGALFRLCQAFGEGVVQQCLHLL